MPGLDLTSDIEALFLSPAPVDAKTAADMISAAVIAHVALQLAPIKLKVNAIILALSATGIVIPPLE